MNFNDILKYLNPKYLSPSSVTALRMTQMSFAAIKLLTSEEDKTARFLTGTICTICGGVLGVRRVALSDDQLFLVCKTGCKVVNSAVTYGEQYFID